MDEAIGDVHAAYHAIACVWRIVMVFIFLNYVLNCVNGL